MSLRDVLAFALIVSATGCGSKKHPSLGRVEDLQQRANSLGCHLKRQGADARCEVLVGACNCRLDLSVSGKFTANGEQLNGDLLSFGVGLWDCPKSQSLAPLWQILDPMFDSDKDRGRLHALLATPPSGAAEDAATKLSTDVGAFRAEITWTPSIWNAVKLPNPSVAERGVNVALFPAHSSHPDDVSTMTVDKPDYPSLCRDGSRRPWAERPTQPRE